MTIEDLVRDAQRRQAGRAVPVERVRSGLTAGIARARRRRRIAAAAGGGLVAAALAAVIAVPSLVIDRDRPPAAVAGPSAKDAPLGFRPAWVPDGLVEHARAWALEGRDPIAVLTTEWVWEGSREPGAGPTVEMELSDQPQVRPLAPAHGEPVDINGAQGTFRDAPAGERDFVTWSPGGNAEITIHSSDPDLPGDQLLRMARSVVPDPGTFVTPLRLGPLPDGYRLTRSRVEGPSPDDWAAAVTLTPPGDFPAEAFLSIRIGRNVPAPPGGTALTVGGRPAWSVQGRAQRPPRPGDQLVVDVGGGRRMVLSTNVAAVTTDVLAGIAEDTVVTGAGVDWLGTR